MDRLSATPIAEQALLDIANALGATLEGPSDVCITNLCTLEPGEEGGLSFLAQGAYAKHLCECKAAAVIVNLKQERPEGFEGSLLRVANPYEAWSRALDSYGTHTGWGSEAIDPSADLHPSVQIAPGVTIGAGVKIGAGTVLHPGVTIYPHSSIGANCILHAGVVIGADGFGFAPPSKAQDGLRKIKHIGHVVLGDERRNWRQQLRRPRGRRGHGDWPWHQAGQPLPNWPQRSNRYALRLGGPSGHCRQRNRRPWRSDSADKWALPAIYTSATASELAPKAASTRTLKPEKPSWAPRLSKLRFFAGNLRLPT